MEGNGDDVEMNVTKNDHRSVSVGNEDYAVAAGVAWRRSLGKEVLKDLQGEDFGFPGFEHFRVPETDAEKLIALAKLDRGHYGVNRKEENLVEVTWLPCPGVKKPKKELSCSLCNESSINDKDLNSHLEGRKHQAKLAAAKAELAAKCCGTPLARSKSASLAAGSELNGDVKGTSPASSASDIAPDAEVEVGEEVGSKTKESASQDCKSLLSKKKYKNWDEMWEDCALAPDNNVANQRSQSNEIVAGLPIRRLSANDEKEDATEQVHDVLENGKVELAFPKAAITAEAFANLVQLRFTGNGKKDDTAIEKADGSTACDAKTNT